MSVKQARDALCGITIWRAYIRIMALLFFFAWVKRLVALKYPAAFVTCDGGGDEREVDLHILRAVDGRQRQAATAIFSAAQIYGGIITH